MKDTQRVLARQLARELTAEECEAISGGDCSGTGHYTYQYPGGNDGWSADIECGF